MSDPYRIGQDTDGPASRKAEGGALRALLWTCLVTSATANAVTSLGGLHPLISVAFGVATVLCIVLLVLHHLRWRR